MAHTKTNTMKLALGFIAILLTAVALHGSAGAWIHGRAAPTTYDGLAATRGSAPSAQRSETQAMARTALFVPSGISKLKVIITNWFGAEIAPGSASTNTASIEYPLGTCTTLKKSGSATITVSNGGQVEVDYATLSVPSGTWIWYRQWVSNPSGVVVQSFQGQRLSLGDALIVGSSVPDQTVTCDPVVDGGTFETIAPLAIIAPITAPAPCILGDSIALGVNNNHAPNSVGDNGAIAPSIGPSFGYSNMAVNAEQASQFVSNHVNRAAVLPYCSHVIVEYGTNDLYLNGDSVATLQANLTTIYGLAAPGSVVFQNTLIARTDSSDFWTTTSGQSYPTSPIPNVEPLRVAFNSALTSGSFGPNGGFFDPQAVIGTGTNNSLWKAGAGFPACAPWTQDGVHPDTCSYYTQLQGSGYIDLSRIHR